MSLQNRLILDAARTIPTPRTPVWIMRQAGRYLPEYREVRARMDFPTLCKRPDLVAELSILPVDLLGVDAAVILSSVLLVPEAMGMRLSGAGGNGGLFFPDPIHHEWQIAALKADRAVDRLRFVYDALSMARRYLHGRVPLIGLAGAPWTLAAYMIEGGGTRDFRRCRTMLYERPEQLRLLLEKIGDAVGDYLLAQIEAGGADLIQIVETWGGVLPKSMFLDFALPSIARIMDRLAHTRVPVILFVKGANTCLPELASLGVTVLSLDWTIDIGEAREVLAGKTALQGNLDPAVLYADPIHIRSSVRQLLGSYGNHPGHIFNLGDVIPPDVPPDHVQALVSAVRELSTR